MKEGNESTISADAHCVSGERQEESITLNVPKSDRTEFLGSIVDVFDDFLAEKDVRIESSAQEMEKDGIDPEENDARLYGGDYFELEERVAKVFDDWKNKK